MEILGHFYKTREYIIIIIIMTLFREGAQFDKSNLP